MDAADFRTLGECDFGTIWYVQGEDRVVVNAFQAALYFSLEEFHQFARMVAGADKKLGEVLGSGAPPAPAPEPAPSRRGGKIREFRSPRPERSDD